MVPIFSQKVSCLSVLFAESGGPGDLGLGDAMFIYSQNFDIRDGRLAAGISCLLNSQTSHQVSQRRIP